MYAHPTPTIKSQLWNHLVSIRKQFHLPWALLRDFNDILVPLEVLEGSFSQARAFSFAHMMEDYGLLDLGFTREKFTWFRQTTPADL